MQWLRISKICEYPFTLARICVFSFNYSCKQEYSATTFIISNQKSEINQISNQSKEQSVSNKEKISSNQNTGQWPNNLEPNSQLDQMLRAHLSYLLERKTRDLPNMQLLVGKNHISRFVLKADEINLRWKSEINKQISINYNITAL